MNESTDVVGIFSALRGQVVAVVLVVLSALTLLLGVVWHGETPVGMRVLGFKSAEIDATVVSAMLEMKDGQWRVRDADSAPTLGTDHVELEHYSRRSILFPRPRQVWSVGGPRLAWSVPAWRLDVGLDILHRHDQPAIGIEEAGSAVRGWRMTSFYGASPIDMPMIATGFNPLAWPMTYAAADGGILHLCLLTRSPAEEFQEVGAWRRAVATSAGRLASPVREDDAGPVRSAWWNRNQSEVVTIAALASVLRVDQAQPSLARLRRDLDRDLTPANLGGTFYPDNARESLDGALAVLSPEGGATEVYPTRLLDHFAQPRAALDWMRAMYADAPSATLLESLADPNDVWSPREPLQAPRPLRTAFGTAILLLALLGTMSARGPARVRRRDVVAVAGLFFYASLGPAFVPHVTLEAAGLVGLGMVVLTLRMRGAITAPEGVEFALLAPAFLLPLASVFVLGPLDALSRALAFGAIAVLAVGQLDPIRIESDAPRRTARKRETLWTSFQVLAVTLSVLALLLAMLNPGSWDTRPPRPKWVLLSLGFVLSLSAGLVVFLRDRRVQPAAAVALTMGIASHLTVLVLSTFVSEWTSGAKEVAAIGMIASAILALFVVLRLGRMAVLSRRAEQAAAAATPS